MNKLPLDAIKALVVSFDPNDSTFSLSLQERELYKSTNLTQSLTEVFTTIGETAFKSETPICFLQIFATLDVGFFKVRYERCTDTDKKFVFAMVKCGELPCTISNIAKNLHKSVNQIFTTRAQLISKGIIFPIRYKELDFTVPEFSGYIQRLDEYKQWSEERE